jgi:hypothetical protein
MGKYYKKYLALAAIGSIIIGVAFYLLLNNYLDKKEIVIVSRDIKAGEKICKEDLELRDYCKSSLPEKFITDKKDVVGKVINIERKKDDHISYEMFNKTSASSFFDELSSGDVVIAVNVCYAEPLLKEVRAGNRVSIVSTIYDKDLINSDYLRPQNVNEDEYLNQPGHFNCKNGIVYDRSNIFAGDDYINNSTFNLSENVFLINGQIIVRNLEVLRIEESISDNSSILINNNNKVVSIYVKCNIKEAPFIAKLTKGDDYKIVIEEI